MSGYVLDRMPECMSDRMSEYYVRQRGKNSRVFDRVEQFGEILETFWQ